MDNLKDLSKITTRYGNRVDENRKQENLDEKIVSSSDKDVKKVASLLGKSASNVQKFVNKYKDLDADDLLDLLDTARAEPHHIRRYSLMVMAAMNGNRRALKELDRLFGFLDEAVNIRGNTKWSNPEAKQFAVNAVSQVAKEIGKAQQRAVSVFTSDMKSGKYDNLDLSKAINTGSIRDASKSKRDVLSALYYDIRDRFNKYGRRKKN